MVTSGNKPNGIYIIGNESYEIIYGPEERAEIAALVNIIHPQQTSQSIRENLEMLHDCEMIFSGWGMAKLDEELLAAAPNLKVVFYGAGSIKGFVTEASWARGIRITSSYAANAVPVAEYTLSQIIFCLKHGWHRANEVRRDKAFLAHDPVPGSFGTTVGIVSLGMIGRIVCAMLRAFDVKVLVYDPFATEVDAEKLNVELTSLEDLFARSDVVSLHTPWLKETEGMITGKLLSSMKRGASFINTSRGAVVNEFEMIEVLALRPDMQAVLDVTWPEPPAADSPLYTLPNVALTPHIAGSQDLECRRMGRYIVQELRQFLNNGMLSWEISQEKSASMA